LQIIAGWGEALGLGFQVEGPVGKSIFNVQPLIKTVRELLLRMMQWDEDQKIQPRRGD
jgi:hypothetical protein